MTWWTDEEVVRLNAEEFAEVSECNGSVRAEPKITVVVRRRLTASFPGVPSHFHVIQRPAEPDTKVTMQLLVCTLIK